MKHFSLLSLATLSASLLLAASANAHDPKEFDRMLDAAPAKAPVTACAKLDANARSKTKLAAADVKVLAARCSAEKKAKQKASATR